MTDFKDNTTHGTQGPSPSNNLEAPQRCRVCQSIADAMLRWHREGHVGVWNILSLGTWKEFLDRVECETCQQIVHHFKSPSRSSNPTPMSGSCPMVLKQMVEAYFICCERLVYTEEEHDHKVLCLWPSESLNPEGSHHVSINSQKIDIAQLQQWQALCETNHGEKCNNILEDHNAGAELSLTLVDVEQFCLVIPTTAPRYVALSYVWGETSDSLMAMIQNLEYLFTPGSLKAHETNSRVPKTILDAMSLVKMMGLKYLWVDRLCIVQDNSRHFNEQLQRMALIYANACFTIVAADGADASYGLRGIDVEASPRDLKQTYYEFSSKAKLLCKVATESVVNPPRWYTRAWTFQERALSRKALVFVNNTVYWQCRSNTWDEEMKPTLGYGAWTRFRKPSDWPFHAVTNHPWPDLAQYYSLAIAFNKRDLSFENDALKAFTAIINTFSGSFPNGFHFGIPEFLFDIGLLWTPYHPLKRRKDFPSWSWLGWSGSIHFEVQKAWEPISYFTSRRPSLRIWPVVKWEKIRRNDLAHVQIDNSYHLWQKMVSHPGVVLPEPWYKKYPKISFNRSEDKFFHPGLKEQEFSFPTPISTGCSLPHPETWLPLLRFKTRRCTVFLGSSCERRQKFYTGTCLLIELRDSSGARIGAIEPFFTSANEYDRSEKIELIGISEAFAEREKLDDDDDPTSLLQLVVEMGLFPELENVDPYNFYNVLWIEWEDGIAYRKALGRVFKDAWERQDLEETDIVLG